MVSQGVRALAYGRSTLMEQDMSVENAAEARDTERLRVVEEMFFEHAQHYRDSVCWGLADQVLCLAGQLNNTPRFNRRSDAYILPEGIKATELLKKIPYGKEAQGIHFPEQSMPQTRRYLWRAALLAFVRVYTQKDRLSLGMALLSPVFLVDSEEKVLKECVKEAFEHRGLPLSDIRALVAQMPNGEHNRTVLRGIFRGFVRHAPTCDLIAFARRS